MCASVLLMHTELLPFSWRALPDRPSRQADKQHIGEKPSQQIAGFEILRHCKFRRARETNADRATCYRLSSALRRCGFGNSCPNRSAAATAGGILRYKKH